MSATVSRLLTISATVVVIVGLYAMFGPHAPTNRLGWERWSEPGKLSKGHASLENNCAACHTSPTGVSATKCILCHADDTALLQRQPSAFHANVGSCNSCHIEHQGLEARPIFMDHAAFAAVSLEQLKRGASGDMEAAHSIRQWLKVMDQPGHVHSAYPLASSKEASLNCASCHSNQDPHLGYFGKDCVQCHSTSKWTVTGYQHPSPQSTLCNECHKPPPSHLMGHFNMMDQGMTGQKDAKLSECFKCHQTDSWNDIKGIGWVKMH